jgi:hypothetical protein
MKKFGATLLRSSYDPAIYARAIKAKNSSVVGFFCLVAVVLTALAVGAAWSLLVSLVQFEANAPKYLDQIVKTYPAELSVVIKGGRASTNVAEPYFIAIPGDSAKDFGGLSHLIVIDTKTPYSSTQFNAYHAAAWLTSDSLFYYGQYSSSVSSGGPELSQIKAMALSEIPDMTIDQAYVRGVLEKFLPWVRALAPVLALVLVGFIYVGMLFKLVYFFVLAGLIWLVTKLARPALTYGQSYRVGVYAAVGPMIAAGVLGVFQVHLPLFSMTLIILVVAVLNLMRLPRSRRG